MAKVSLKKALLQGTLWTMGLALVAYGMNVIEAQPIFGMACIGVGFICLVAGWYFGW